METYLTEEGFDFPRLLNDDFLRAIKLLLNEGYYISGLKLLFSAIDTIAYLDVGDEKDNFTTWLRNYAELEGLGVSAEELWECRNALLHMTGIESRKVRQGSVRKLVPAVGMEPPKFIKELENDTAYLNIHKLYMAFCLALPKWIDTYNKTPQKWQDFIDRYDEVTSEARLSILRPL